MRVNSKVGGLSTRSIARCVEKVFQYSTQSLQSPNSVPFCSPALFLPFSSNHVTAQAIGPWASRRAGPSGKAHLVPLIVITALSAALTNTDAFLLISASCQSRRKSGSFRATTPPHRMPLNPIVMSYIPVECNSCGKHCKGPFLYIGSSNCLRINKGYRYDYSTTTCCIQTTLKVIPKAFLS